ncbi:TonB-dependent receptor [Marinomonas ostreistagni]|uniref:TonB-dependent receptor n=1 Tax=Marinomonas ostreistagni TaxID=359209 RepID=A0ABS0ZEB6_9GAMM|nr:TonB-dependent receptor [Marinomonas ostreistagni]MBJ7552016.1 TonB-dependent receptor [Marinomonas ostreistagni]
MKIETLNPTLKSRALVMCVISFNVMAADDSANSSLPIMMVTADKVEQPQTETSRNVTKVYGEDLQQSGVDSLDQLEGIVSGLNFQPFGQSGVNSPVIRGVTSNMNAFSSSVLLLVDGVPTLMAQGFDSSFVDVKSVEVARGPQTAVYGHNAETGVISIVSNDLDETERTELSFGVGSRNKHTVGFLTSQELSPNTLYASVSGEYVEQDGFIDQDTTGGKADDREHYNLNTGLKWVASDQTDMTIRFRSVDYDDGAALWGSATTENIGVSSGTDSWNRSSGQSLSFKVNHTNDSGIHFSSITAYNDYSDDVQQDTDFQTSEVGYIARDNRFKTFSQEFKMDGENQGNSWLFGGYFEQQDYDLRAISQSYYYGLSDLRTKQEGSTYALFGNISKPLISTWSLSGGARIARDKVKITPESSYSREDGWTNFTPQITIKDQYRKNHQFYLSYSEGVRTGGFNSTTASANYREYDPETVHSIEMGLKGENLTRSVQYAVAAYHMEIDDMQVMQMPSVGVIYLTNAAEATSDGVELSLNYLLSSNWQLQTGIAWNRTRFDDYTYGSSDYSGNTNPFAPEWNGHVTLRYDDDEDWNVMVSTVYNSKVYLDAGNNYQQDGYNLINLSASYPLSERASLSGYINNLADKEYNAVGYQNGYVTVYSPPREIGLKFTMRL